MTEILESLFGSRSRARLLRFFLLNPNIEYSFPDILEKNMIKKTEAKKELNNLKKINFISTKRRKGVFFYSLNLNFPFYPEMRSLIIKSNIYPQCAGLGKIKNIGDVKLALVTGVFLNYSKSKADLVLVVDNLSRARLNNAIRNLEAEVGKEIRYVLMTSEELKYRLNMTDRFLLEIFESPHDELINKVQGLKRYLSGIKK